MNTTTTKLIYTVVGSKIKPFLIESAKYMKHNKISLIKFFLINYFLIKKPLQV